MDYTFYCIIVLLSVFGVVELAEIVAGLLLPALVKTKPITVWIEGSNAEYHLRRAVRDAKRLQYKTITVVCVDSEAKMISHIIEHATPWLEFNYADARLEKAC